MRLPDWVPSCDVTEKVSARFKDGVLAVVIGRSKAKKARGIEITIH